MNYFEQLLHVLALEREADRQSYLQFTAQTSVIQRRTNGQSWYPIAIKDTEVGYGAYLSIEVERTTYREILHQFRFGSSVALFSNHNPAEDRLNGTITFIHSDRMKIALRVEELPDWADNGKLGVDLLFDEYSYEEMRKALEKGQKLLETRAKFPLLQVLTGEAPTSFSKDTLLKAPTQLNLSQQEALKNILQAHELAIVHGPPGTGKTTTLVQAIQALWERDQQQLLVVAPSNAAVDLLTEKLSEAGLSVIRIGNPIRISEHLMNLTLDQQIAQHKDMRDIKKMKKQASQFQDMAHKYKRNYGPAEREQRKALLKASKQLAKEVSAAEEAIAASLLDKTQVITATLVGANHVSIRNRQFGTLVIDEAGQALEPACWIPILKAQKLVLAGDHHQLPPTLKSEEAAKQGLGETLLEKNVKAHPEAVSLLQEQYRMHESIMQFPSGIFYNNALFAHPSVAKALLFPGDEPLQFIDTAGCGFEEKVEDVRISNPEEASFLMQYLGNFLTQLALHKQTIAPSIAIIAPYNEQLILLKDLYRESPLVNYPQKININTIDSFQGQESDIVCISLTRSNNDRKIGFLSDIRRMNVAMTRARKKLIVIGDSATLSSSAFYADFITYAEGLNAYHSAWEFR